MLSSIESYYSAIGMVPNDTRKTDQVMARNAIGVALSQWADSQQEVAEVLNRDRSTIAHMTLGHEDNLMYWKGYEDLYKMAVMIVDNRLCASSKADKLASITNKIYILEQEAAILRNELNSISISQ